MRARLVASVVLGVATLLGISGAALASPGVQLFGDDGTPRFNFYLACVSKTVDCSIIEHMFDRWAGTRALTVHDVQANDVMLSSGNPSQAPEQNLPYRVTVRYAPEMQSLSNSLQSGSSGAPVVSYMATVRIFDATSGKLLKSMSMHDEKMVDQSSGAANPYLEAHVKAFLKRLDPTGATSPTS